MLFGARLLQFSINTCHSQEETWTFLNHQKAVLLGIEVSLDGSNGMLQGRSINQLMIFMRRHLPLFIAKASAIYQ